MFEKYSAYAILTISVGAFIWLSSCAMGEYGTKVMEGVVKSYDKFKEAQIEHSCKDLVLRGSYVSDKISCPHPDQNCLSCNP